MIDRIIYTCGGVIAVAVTGVALLAAAWVAKLIWHNLMGAC